MKCFLLAPGRIQHPGAEAYCNDFQARISRLAPFERLMVRQAKRRKGGRATRAMRDESRGVLALLPAGAHLVAVDPHGVVMNSDQFYQWYVQRMESGVQSLAFAIGGPDGLTEQVFQRAHKRLSLSAMTFPHELAEVILLEQIYRALMRRKGFPYHR